MNAELLKANWPIAKAKLKQEFPELTEADLAFDESSDEELFRRIEQRTGQTREQLEFFFEIECGCVDAKSRVRRGPPGSGTKPSTAGVSRAPQAASQPPVSSSAPPTPPPNRPAPREQKPDSMAHEIERSTGVSGKSGGA